MYKLNIPLSGFAVGELFEKVGETEQNVQLARQAKAESIISIGKEVFAELFIEVV